MKPIRRSAQWAAIAGFAILLGLGWTHPTLSLLAWPALTLLAIAVAPTRTVWGVFGMTLLGGTAARLIAFPWATEMNIILFQHSHLMAMATKVAEAAAPAACVAFGVTVGWTLTQMTRRAGVPVPVPFWLPAAWTLGEECAVWSLTLGHDIWLNSQWQVTPVLRLLGHLGWWPAMLLCGVIWAGPAQAVLTRRWRWMATLAGAPLLLMLPALPDVHRDLLEGVAAIHMADDVTLPHRGPTGAQPELIIWPEDALHLRPMLHEGETPGARVRPLLPGSDAEHLVGLVTQARLAGRLNQLVHVGPDGAVRSSRAKRLLLPLGERRILGLGFQSSQPGVGPVVMSVGGRSVIALICGESFSRALVAEGVAAGGELLVVSARDHILPSPQAFRQIFAAQVLRSVEAGLPSVRASLSGRAAFVASTGEVLAQSDGPNGFLMYDATHGARAFRFDGQPVDAPQSPPLPAVAVLYSKTSPRLRTRCPEGACTGYLLEHFKCPGTRASTVIVAGHGLPPNWLSHQPAEVARAVACFKPDLIVIDTCLGATAELLTALAPLDAVIVAATTLVPAGGLVYAPRFFEPGPPEARAEAVRLEQGDVLAGRITAADIADAEARVAAMSTAERRDTLARRRPPLVRASTPHGAILVPIETAPALRGRRRRRARRERR